MLWLHTLVPPVKANNFGPEDSEHNNHSLQVPSFTRGGDVTKGINPDNGFTAPQLKPRFYLFQRVRDQLYLTLPTLVEHTSSMGTYFGALGFTKPLGKLVLHAVPLQSLLDWLSKPKGPNLVEASMAAAPDKALVLVVTKRMLYGEETPLVGVGLMYKPHYISTEPFSAAYMHLHVWHAAGSSVESEDKLNSSRLIFVNVSEMSNVIPVVTQHPILLDVATKETMMRTGEPMAHLSLRGFRHLLPGSLLKLWRVAAELHSQQRPLTRGREPWRLHTKSWNTFTPSVSRPCMKWGA